MERRYLKLTDVECRKKDDKSLSLSGYAIRFEEASELIFDEFVEYIDRRALDNTELDNTFLLYNHNTDYVLGNTSSKTLSLNITEVGLRFSVDLPNTAKAKEIHELIKRGDINGMSFGFTTKKDAWNMQSEPIQRRVLEIGELLEISIVPLPAYESTKVETNTLEKVKECKECRVGVEALFSNLLEDEAKEILNKVQKC